MLLLGMLGTTGSQQNQSAEFDPQYIDFFSISTHFGENQYIDLHRLELLHNLLRLVLPRNLHWNLH